MEAIGEKKIKLNIEVSKCIVRHNRTELDHPHECDDDNRNWLRNTSSSPVDMMIKAWSTRSQLESTYI